tara:strand:+ start:288 stop:563 length:276 start_codon:yes stop_codon:yes gene_type:complete
MEKGNGFGPDFIKSLLLTLEQTNYDEFMKLTYVVMMQSPSEILKRKDSIETKVDAINTMISFFEENEEYEKCTNLQKLKHMLFLDTDKDDI